MSEPRRSTAERTPRICVFAPDPVLTITLEDLPDGSSELHVHAGGQGFWIARMARTLGARVSLCGAFGGETGTVLHDVIARSGLEVHSVRTRGPNGAYIHDRRGADGDRRTIADIEPMALSRHEADDLFGIALGAAISADVMVLGGTRSGGVVPTDVFSRLTADLSGLGIPVVADLSGDTMAAAASAGLTVLKVSHEDLLGCGHVDSAAESHLAEAMTSLAEEGTGTIVVSRAADPALVLSGGEFSEVVSPPLRVTDPAGAGDSMTAGIAVGLARGDPIEGALKLGAAAGAANVTRHGLATGQRAVVARLADTVVVRRCTGDPGR
ncbi:PfkB family carbohydrate kinase [Rhodococcus sp. NPDC003322]